VQEAHAKAIADAEATQASAVAQLTEEHKVELKAIDSEKQKLLARLATLQDLVDESAAAHKAHVELKELRTKSKCVFWLPCACTGW
jgi:hypothetical protein